MLRIGRHVKFYPWLRQAVGASYAALFALVLPFVCWGAAATPGHPHALPHFVFAMPQPTANALPIAARDHHGGNHHGGAHNHADAHHAGADDLRAAESPTPTGQSTPATLFAMLLILTGICLIRIAVRHGSVYWIVALENLTVALPVPVPPPRPVH